MLKVIEQYESTSADNEITKSKRNGAQKVYGFDEVFTIFYEIDNKCNKLNEYNSRISNKIGVKNVMLGYLKIMEDRLIDLFSNSSTIRKINNDNYKEYFRENIYYHEATRSY